MRPKVRKIESLAPQNSNKIIPVYGWWANFLDFRGAVITCGL